MASPVRVLHVVGGMARGGAETMIMNLYRQVDRSRLQFDFLCTHPEEQSYDAEIRDLGGRILHIDGPSRAGYPRYLRQVGRTLADHGPFRAVHAHTLFNTGLIAAVAKRAQVPVRVCHAHSTADAKNESLLGTVYHAAMRRLILHCATHLVACGEKAGRYLFGDRAYNDGRVIALNNGLDLRAYQGISRDRLLTRYHQEFGFAERDIVLGHVGGFRPVKNHVFLVELMAELVQHDPRYRLVLVGDGATRDEVEALVRQRGLEEHIAFAGVRADIPELMTYFDLFLLPSLYEGLPVTVIEAQAAGTPCILSDAVTHEVDLGLGLVCWAPLGEMVAWVEALESSHSRPETTWGRREAYLQGAGYSAFDNVKRLCALYGLDDSD